MEMLGNQSKRVKLKTGSTVFRQKQTHVEPMSETAKQFLFQPEKKWLRQNLLRDHELSFDRKRYFEEPNNSPRLFTRHILFDANRHTLAKPCGCFFHQRKNGVT